MTYASITTTATNYNAREKSIEIPQMMEGGPVFAPKSKCILQDKYEDNGEEIVVFLAPWWCFTKKDTNPVYSIYFPTEAAKKAGEWKRAYNGLVEV